jgi:hypothetical protein
MRSPSGRVVRLVAVLLEKFFDEFGIAVVRGDVLPALGAVADAD